MMRDGELKRAKMVDSTMWNGHHDDAGRRGQARLVGREATRPLARDRRPWWRRRTEQEPEALKGERERGEKKKKRKEKTEKYKIGGTHVLRWEIEALQKWRLDSKI